MRFGIVIAIRKHPDAYHIIQILIFLRETVFISFDNTSCTIEAPDTKIVSNDDIIIANTLVVHIANIHLFINNAFNNVSILLSDNVQFVSFKKIQIIILDIVITIIGGIE